MRPVNLIPPEERRGASAPLRAGAFSYGIVAVLALALAGVVLVVLTGNDIKESEADLAALDARKAQADLAAASVADYEQFATLEQTRSDTVSSLAQSRFDWERVLNELALVIPRRVTFESLSGTVGGAVAPGGEDTAAAAGAIAGPSLQISGCADGQRGVARFLAALRDIDGVTRVGMQSSALGDPVVPGTAEPASDSAAGGATSSDCQTVPAVAKFQVTVAFDAVPVPESAAPAAPADAAPATTESGVAETQTEQAAAETSADEQVSEAQGVAEAVGVGAQ